MYSSLRLLLTPAEKLGRSAEASEHSIVVSLTSIPSRLSIVPITIRSILDQDVQPQQIVLWLNEELRGRVPRSLGRLRGERFSIRFSTLDCPHLKLVASLAEFPDRTIVTCDDDHIYPRSWLRRLEATHRVHPGDIIAHECRTIAYDDAGDPLPYSEWTYDPDDEHRDRVLALGYGGVIYPPHSLHEDATNRDLFEKLAPAADDLWFKAMATRAGTSIRRSADDRPAPLPIAFSQRVSLKRTNIVGDRNRTQWVDLVRHFGLEAV